MDLVTELSRLTTWTPFSIFCRAFGLQWGDSLHSFNGVRACEAHLSWKVKKELHPTVEAFCRRELLNTQQELPLDAVA